MSSMNTIRRSTNAMKSSHQPKPNGKLLDEMTMHYSAVTAHTAVAAHEKVLELYDHFLNAPNQELIDRWKAYIDKAAADKMTKMLHALPFQTIKVGSEGDKEVNYAGEAAASVKGVFGRSSLLVMEGVSDAVEGTTPASRRLPGASSVIAIVQKPSPNKIGIKATPQGIHYLIKFIGPPQANGVVDLDRPHEENLKQLIKVLGIHPEELTQITMDPAKPGREINQQFITAAKNVGVNVKLINVGDFIPGVRATMDPKRFGNKPFIVVGRGGFEEGIMAGAAARALGGFMQAKIYDKNPEKMQKHPLLRLEEDLVPADPKHTLVSATFITPDNEWFNQPGIKEKSNSLETTTMIVTHEGIKFDKKMV